MLHRESVSPPRSSNRTCGFPASGSPTGFTAGMRRAFDTSVMSVSARLGFTTQLARKASGTTRCFTGLRQVTHRRLLQQAHQKSGSFPPPALPSFIGYLRPSPTPARADVLRHRSRRATLAQHGPPPLARSPVSTCRAHYPGGPVQVRRGCFPRSCCLPRTPGGSASTTSLSRPAQASFALRPVELLARRRRTRPSQRQAFVAGLRSSRLLNEPPASYRANRPLPGWDLHPQGDRPLRGAPELRREGKQRFARALHQRRETRQRSANKNLLRESPCALREILCRKLTTLSGRDRWVSVLRQRMTISTRRFCGSRTPGPVGTSSCVSPKPWMPMAACGTPSLTSSACTALARRTERPWLY